MNSEFASQSNIPGQPLEPGRPDIMPNPAAEEGQQPWKEGEQPLEDDGGVLEEEDMGDVEVNNSVSGENPAPR